MIHVGDTLTVLRTLEPESVQCCVTRPPYWGLRDYGVPGQLGLEHTPAEYVQRMAAVFEEVRRVLRADGTLWLNLGDSYVGGNNQNQGPDAWVRQGRNGMGDTAKAGWTGLPAKNLVGIPWRLAFALQDAGWYLRSDIIWAKPNPMPESVTDRPTKAHEYIFLLSKSARYFYDADAIAEPLTTDPSENYPARATILGRGQQSFNGDGARENDRDKSGGFPPLSVDTRNARTVWTIATSPYPEAHFATFPPEIPRRCILAGTSHGDTVLDPFAGAGTTGLVASRLQRRFIGIELNPTYAAMAERRIHDDAPLLANLTPEAP